MASAHDDEYRGQGKRDLDMQETLSKKVVQA
jgi:hypothetical protein